MNPVIEVTNLSKSYKLYRSKKERIKELLWPGQNPLHTPFQALKEVSFSVNQGEILGIIGQNGSGKSTLMKILAGVVSPSSGVVKCHGRITALLELGAGFSPELTGVENIYFLGAIQGLPKDMLDDRVDEILNFANIGEYAWQPVKNYSSGMYVRLAFSLSIHIDPEILIIDEALSVGDVRFQQKCFRKIREFKDLGKTIIFCSHGMQTIRDFCTKVIWIHEGSIKEIGLPQFVTQNYTQFMAFNQTEKHDTSVFFQENASIRSKPFFSKFQNFPWLNLTGTEQSGKGKAKIEAIAISGNDYKSITFISSGNLLVLSLIISSTEILPECSIQISIHNSIGSTITLIAGYNYGNAFTLLHDSYVLIEHKFETPDLPNGQYSISIGLQSRVNNSWVVQHHIHDALFFNMHSDPLYYNSPGNVIVKNVDFSKKELQ